VSRLHALLLLVWSGWALAADVRVAVVAAPPATDGTGRVAVIALGDDVRQTIAAAPVDALRAEVGVGTAKVVGAKPLADEGAITMLAFDQSGSFKKHWPEAFDLARSYAGALVAAPPHRVGVVTFGVRMDEHGVASGSSDVGGVLATAEAQGAIQGYTRLRNFIREAATRAEALLPLSKGGLREVVVFTDAGEESTAYSVAEVVAHARSLGVRINVVVFYSPSQTAARRLDEVKQIAEGTGGRFIQVDTPENVRDAIKDLATAPSRTFWVDLAYCGVPTDRGERFDDTIDIEVWKDGARLAASGAAPFRQHAAKAAVKPCATPAPADAVDPNPQPRGMRAWLWWALPLALLSLLLLLLVLLAVRRRRKGPVESPPLANAEPPPAPAPKVAPPPAPKLASPFEPTDDPWDNPLERLPPVDLELVTGPSGLRPKLRLTRRSTTVGARPESDLRLDVPQISSEHAVVQLYPNGNVFVRDEGSTNGTFVDGDRVDPASRKPVKPGQTISFSRKIVYRLVRNAHEQAGPGLPPPPPPPPEAPRPSKARTIIAPVRPPKEEP
jgi:hypothetical protein